MDITTEFVPEWNASVYLRKEGSDRATLADVLDCPTHLPPEDLEPEIVLDLGSYVGLTALDFFKRYGCWVYGAEIDFENYRIAQLNTIYFDYIKILPLAIGGATCMSSYIQNRDGQNAHRLGAGEQRCMQIMLHDFISLNHLDGNKIDYVKVDIEGAEDELKSSLRRIHNVGCFGVEVHEPNDYGAIAREFELHGYKISEINNHDSAFYASKDV